MNGSNVYLCILYSKAWFAFLIKRFFLIGEHLEARDNTCQWSCVFRELPYHTVAAKACIVYVPHQENVFVEMDTEVSSETGSVVLCKYE